MKIQTSGCVYTAFKVVCAHLYQVCGTGCMTSFLNINDILLLQLLKVRGGREEKGRGPGDFHHDTHPTALCAPPPTAPPACAPHVSTNSAPACSPAFYTTDAGVSSQAPSVTMASKNS